MNDTGTLGSISAETVPQPRNPATDPCKGDIVRSTMSLNVRERCVTGTVDKFVWYFSYIGAARRREQFCLITTWQNWCRTHRVQVHRGTTP